MKAICIDGKPKITRLHLPEGVPLEVSDAGDNDYWVNGYDYCAITKQRVTWNQRRFVPISNIDEVELLQERQKQLA